MFQESPHWTIKYLMSADNLITELLHFPHFKKETSYTKTQFNYMYMFIHSTYICTMLIFVMTKNSSELSYRQSH